MNQSAIFTNKLRESEELKQDFRTNLIVLAQELDGHISGVADDGFRITQDYVLDILAIVDCNVIGFDYFAAMDALYYVSEVKKLSKEANDRISRLNILFYRATR